MNWHYIRAAIWPISLPFIYFLGGANSVFLVLCLSLYANFASDLAAGQAAEAKKAAQE